MSKTGQSVNFLKLLSQLEKCSSTQSLYKVLVQIRTDLIKESEGVKLLKEKGGLKRIIKLLSKPNEKILNVALSILANCCLQEDCRDLAVSNGVIPLIIPIMKNINQDNIQSRVCRLIGNLTQNPKIAEKFHEHHIVPVIVTVLSNSSSASTQQTAIRSLRLLWEVSKYRSDMLRTEAVKSVANCLSSNDKDVKSAAIKALASFSKMVGPAWVDKSVATAAQLQGGQPDFTLLVAEVGDPHANQCLYNLSCLECSRLQLIKDGLVEQVLTKLQTAVEHSLVLIFCQLCQDSIGRARVRSHAGGLQLLLRLLQSNNSKVIQSKALKALGFFVYDKTSLEILLHNGMVHTLMKSLADYIARHGRQHESTSVAPEPPAGSVSPCSSGLSPQSVGRGMRAWSPFSSEDCSPPGGVYSPLCLSEDELEPTPTLADDDDTINQKMEEEVNDLNEEEVILKFLHHITNYVHIPISDLVAKLTISTLIDYICLVRRANPHAGRLLCAIAGNKNYYRQLLDEHFVLEIHCRLCRPSHEQCVECDRMLDEGTRVITEVSRLAQTGLGEGEMTYRLLKAEQPVKLLISLTIPHVINERDLLLKLLFKRKAIEYLMQALENKQDEAVASLHALFNTLGVDNPQNTQARICAHCDVGSLRKPGTVKFLLDDGSTVSANKSSLCNNSPVFEAMFRGGFKESDQAEVKLTDISADCVAHFSRIIDTYCECILPKNIRTLLELVVVSDRFLVPELSTKIHSVVMNHALDYRTSCVVYDWALDVGYKYPGLGPVSTDIVKFVFIAPMTPAQRVQAVSLMLGGKHKKELLEDVLEIVKSRLFY